MWAEVSEGWFVLDRSFIFYFFFLDQPGRYLDSRLGDKGALDWNRCGGVMSTARMSRVLMSNVTYVAFY